MQAGPPACASFRYSPKAKGEGMRRLVVSLPVSLPVAPALQVSPARIVPIRMQYEGKVKITSSAHLPLG